MKSIITLFYFTAFFSFININAQQPEILDSLIEAFEVNIEPIELIYHPIQKHFLYSQNKLVINQSSRELAATFDDPSRVLYRHAGISMANDQNNSIVYRGLPSEFTKWSINGAEIVNPNHLSNAGRISDQSSPSAGGVLAIPFELINKFSFYGNPYGPEQVNAVAAVSDFNFDIKGDNFFKVGLLGLEAGFQTKDKIKVKGNFRYSTVGLLSDFGVNFDGESIKFYDGFVKAELTDKISLIILAGNSTNFHKAIDTFENSSALKDLQEIDFTSKFGVVGITYEDETFSHSLFVSQRETSKFIKTDTLVRLAPDALYETDFKRSDKKLSYNGYRKFEVLNSTLKLGLQYQINSTQLSRTGDPNLLGSTPFLKPYSNLNFTKNFKKINLKIEPGFAINLLDHKDIKLEPSFFTQLIFQELIFDFNYALKYSGRDINKILDLQSSYNRVKSYSVALKYYLEKNQLAISTRLFKIDVKSNNYLLQSFYNGSIGLDAINPHLLLQLPNDSKIKTKGIEVMLDKSWNGGWYTHFNTSFFNAQYHDLDINTDENFKSIYNVAITKEITTHRNNKWVFNLAYHQRGGGFQNIYNIEDQSFGERKLSNYSRIDARFQYTWKNKNILTLDIQNLSNKQNDAYYFYDSFLNEEVLEKQLGTIPVLSYKRIL